MGLNVSSSLIDETQRVVIRDSRATRQMLKRRNPCSACSWQLFSASPWQPPGLADHRYVDWTGNGNYEDLTAGVSWAAPGDTVFVRPGTYSGLLNRALSFGGRDIELVSTDGPEVTIIDCEGADRAFTFESGETPAALVSGLTVANGLAGYGGGMLIAGSSPTIANCHFTNCEATASTLGGGAFMRRSSAMPLITDLVVSECSGDYGGALCSYQGAAPTLTNVQFLNNTAMRRGGAAYIESHSAGPVALTDCVFYGNTVSDPSGYGGGLCLFNATPNITGNTFAWNSADHGGCMVLMMSSSPTVQRCILSFSQIGNAIHNHGYTNFPVTTHCCVFGNAAGDSLVGTHSSCSFDDPLFCDVFTGDLHLCANSPVAPGNPWGLVGAYDVGCPDCVAPVQMLSRGSLKALFR